MYTVTWRSKGGRIEGVFVPANENLMALVHIFEKSEEVVQYKVIDHDGVKLPASFFFGLDSLKIFTDGRKWGTMDGWPYVPWE